MDPVPEIVSLDPHTLGEVLGDVRTLAQATDAKDAGVDLVQDAAARIDRVRSPSSDAPRMRVAMLEWLDPIFVGGHWVPQLIEYAGGVDLLGLPGRALRAALVGGGRRRAARGRDRRARAATTSSAGCRRRAPTRDRLRALGAERIVIADACAWFSRPGPRLVEGLEWLGHALHPRPRPRAAGRRRRPLVGRDGDRARDRGDADQRAEGHGRAPSSCAGACDSSSTTNVTTRPPIRPPTWPPSEMPETKSVMHEVERRGSAAGPDCMRSMLRLRAITIAAPSRP